MDSGLCTSERVGNWASQREPIRCGCAGWNITPITPGPKDVLLGIDEPVDLSVPSMLCSCAVRYVILRHGIWLWLKKTVPKWNPGKPPPV